MSLVPRLGPAAHLAPDVIRNLVHEEASSAELRGKYLSAGALLSRDGRYRYRLWREWEAPAAGGTCAFLMLNPSTADAREDDPTIRRCVGFAKAWGFSRLEVVNLFAYRSTSPAELKLAESPVGVANTQVTLNVVLSADRTVMAWGAAGGPLARDRAGSVLGRIDLSWSRRRPGVGMLDAIVCLGLTASGAPRHPLYVKGSVVPVPYRTGPFWQPPPGLLEDP